jgi:hypothetical protein
MQNDFNRCEKQCKHCSCNVDNCGECEIIDPDSECTLIQDMEATTTCDFFDDIRRYR